MRNIFNFVSESGTVSLKVNTAFINLAEDLLFISPFLAFKKLDRMTLMSPPYLSILLFSPPYLSTLLYSPPYHSAFFYPPPYFSTILYPPPYLSILLYPLIPVSPPVFPSYQSTILYPRHTCQLSCIPLHTCQLSTILYLPPYLSTLLYSPPYQSALLYSLPHIPPPSSSCQNLGQKWLCSLYSPVAHQLRKRVKSPGISIRTH